MGQATRAILTVGNRTRNVTVLQVLPSLVTGGVERGTIEITQAVTRAGWTALVAKLIQQSGATEPE